MRTQYLILILVTFPALSQEPFEPPPIFGSAPQVKDWIWITVAGLRNYMPPVVYLSTSSFKTRAPEELIVLTPERYAIVATFTANRLTRSDCLTRPPPPYAEYTVAMYQHRDGESEGCILPRVSICEYLTSLKNLNGIDWAPAECKPIGALVGYLGCSQVKGAVNSWSDRGYHLL